MVDHTQVDNPQLAWLKDRQYKVADALHVLQTGFTNAQTAMGQGAWTGKAGKDWEQEFTGRVTQVAAAAKTVEDDLDQEIASKPTTVCSCQLLVGFIPSSGYTNPLIGFGSYPHVAAHCTEES